MDSNQCSLFSTDVDPDEWVPCRCPACQGFLPNDFPIGEQFLCKKCVNLDDPRILNTYETEVGK